VQTLARTIADWRGGADIAISNAAARIPQVPDEQQVRAFVDTSNHGTVRMIRAFVPLLRDGTRFVVVAGSFGTLANLDPQLHPRSSIRPRPGRIGRPPRTGPDDLLADDLGEAAGHERAQPGTSGLGRQRRGNPRRLHDGMV
jgi:NAD(P)-dependent dehydrogenase (short-subunit alcohol dehydrogenase family)